MYTTVLFDLDGTLLDTSEGIFATANHTLVRLGRNPIPTNQLGGFIGPPLHECFRSVCSVPDHDVDTAVDYYREQYRNDGMYRARIYDGIPEVLDYLVHQGCNLAIATLKHEEIAAKMTAHLGLDRWIPIVAGGDDAGLLTKAQIILRATSRCPTTDLSQVLMIGDTMHDLEGARIAGVDFLGVTYGFGLKATQAIPGIKTAPSAQELLAILRGKTAERGKSKPW